MEALMPAARSRIVKWGNSQAIRIPKKVLDQARLQEGDELEIRVDEGRITLESLNSKLTLKSLVARITRENQHYELDWGKPVGKEVW
jgi:antitoxin MazE